MMALTEKIIFAARVTGNKRKLRALGALLGTSARHPGSEQHETSLLIDALAAIAGSHVLVMDVLANLPPTPTAATAWPLPIRTTTAPSRSSRSHRSGAFSRI
jgi:hypothetical protein